MRILLVNKFHYRRGGDCVHTFALADLLRRRGHEVFFFSMRHPRNEPSAQEPYFVDYIDYRDLNLRKTPVNAARVLLRSIYSRQARSRIRQLIRDLNPDIAHLQNIHTHLTPSILLELNAAGIPVLWTLHDYKLICPEDSFLSQGRLCEECKGRRFYRCVINRCKKGSRAASLVAALEAYVHQSLRIPRRVSLFVAPSRFLQEKFVEFGWPGKKIIHLRNFLPEFPEEAPPTGTYGLYLGSLLPTKGVRTLVKALAQHPDLPFHILGDGAERAFLEEEARRQSLRHVEFRGFVTGGALRREIEGAAFGVAPSEWYENCPYSVMELMAAGKPVIASRIGGLPELIEHEKTGLLFEAGHAEDLARQITALTSDRTRRIALGGQARRFAEEMFNAERYGQAIETLYAGRRQGREGRP